MLEIEKTLQKVKDLQRTYLKGIKSLGPLGDLKTDSRNLETVNSVRNQECAADMDNRCASSVESFGKLAPKLDIDCITSLLSPFLLYYLLIHKRI